MRGLGVNPMKKIKMMLSHLLNRNLNIAGRFYVNLQVSY